MIESIKNFHMDKPEGKRHLNFSQTSASNSSTFSATCTSTTLLSAEYKQFDAFGYFIIV